MKNELDILKLDYECSKDFLFSFTGTFIGLAIGFTQLPSKYESYSIYLAIGAILFGIVTIICLFWVLKTYNALKDYYSR